MSSKKYKLRIYNLSGINKGNIKIEEFFETKKEMDERYKELFSHSLYSLNPTAWEYTHGEWVRISGY